MIQEENQLQVQRERFQIGIRKHHIKLYLNKKRNLSVPSDIQLNQQDELVLSIRNLGAQRIQEIFILLVKQIRTQCTINQTQLQILQTILIKYRNQPLELIKIINEDLRDFFEILKFILEKDPMITDYLLDIFILFIEIVGNTDIIYKIICDRFILFIVGILDNGLRVQAQVIYILQILIDQNKFRNTIIQSRRLQDQIEQIIEISAENQLVFDSFKLISHLFNISKRTQFPKTRYYQIIYVMLKNDNISTQILALEFLAGQQKPPVEFEDILNILMQSKNETIVEFSYSLLSRIII
ncbi:hypothetical protein pb186bvf_005359 [Paramecium bursaria]